MTFLWSDVIGRFMMYSIGKFLKEFFFPSDGSIPWLYILLGPFVIATALLCCMCIVNVVVIGFSLLFVKKNELKKDSTSLAERKSKKID